MADLDKAEQVETKVGELTYTILDPGRWHELEEIFRENNSEVPDPSVAMAAAVIDEKGDIVAFHVLQLVYHAEPVWIRPDMVGKVEVKKLITTLERVFRLNGDRGTYFVFARNPDVEKLCEQSGMKKLPWVVYRKDL